MNLGVLTAFLKPIESNFSKAFSKNTICRRSCCLYGQENRRIHTITLLCSNTHYLPKGWEQILTRATGRLFLLTRIKVLQNKERIPYWRKGLIKDACPAFDVNGMSGKEKDYLRALLMERKHLLNRMLLCTTAEAHG